MSSVSVAPLGPADEADFVAAVLASRHLHRPWVDPPDSAERFRVYLRSSARAGRQNYLVRHGLCGAPAGYVTLSPLRRTREPCAGIGYAAFAGHHRRGLMTSALAAVLSEAAALGLTGLHADIRADNEASVALARRLGFSRQTGRRHPQWVAGAWYDHERWVRPVPPAGQPQ